MAKYDETTLVVKHLPHELDVRDRVDLLKRLGAVDVTCVASPVNKSSLAFAKFRTSDESRAVLRQLHQKIVLGSVLSVEFAKGGSAGGRIVSKDEISKNEIPNDETTTQRKLVESYLRKLNSWTNGLDFSQAPPVHIRYQYPPPSTQVLKNICRVLARVPKFYTQVLHLMNKMNLPCPFMEDFVVETELVGEDFIENEAVRSEEESEIDSDEGERAAPFVPKLAKKRISTTKLKFGNFAKFVKPNRVASKHSAQKPEEVFETSQVQIPKKIELIVSTDLATLSERETEPEVTESFGILEAPTPAASTEGDTAPTNETTNLGVISSEELEMNRIPPKDFHLIPVFKNYQPGPPSCRLYIKNLAKAVQINDLEFIFNRYRVEESGDQVHLYDVRLMQEGRMKGQAFVTLQNVALAEKALKETNGYILKGKTMVVQFARSSKPK